MNDGNPSSPVFAPGELDVGRIFTLTFRSYFKNFATFTLITLLVTSPNLVWTWLILQDVSVDDVVYGSSALTAYNWGSSALALLLQPIATGAVMYGVFMHMKTGRMAEVGPSLVVGFSKLLPVLGVAIVAGLAMLGGLLLFIVPGVMIAVALYVAVPAAVADRLGVMDAIQYSRDLTRGQRWRILGVIAIFGGIQVGFYLVVTAFAVMGGAMRDPVALFKVPLIASFVSVPFFTALNSVAPALVYHDLRVMKEGVDTESLEAIFD